MGTGELLAGNWFDQHPIQGYYQWLLTRCFSMLKFTFHLLLSTGMLPFIGSANYHIFPRGSTISRCTNKSFVTTKLASENPVMARQRLFDEYICGNIST